MTPATSEPANLDVVSRARDERKAVYGYVYEYVYGGSYHAGEEV
jgi:hypothetical protein